MARLITKFKYLKPNARESVGGYARYIATREGVDKIDESYKLEPSSKKQQNLIEKILRDFPDSKEMLEYEDYLKEPTVGNASEFITRALEDNAYEVMQTKTYADYIATRPRAQRFGTHGLFTDDGVRVKLHEVSDDLGRYEGNVWTVIISLRREDAERLGYNAGERWRDMLRTQTEALSKNFKIPMESLKWYGAFHNESHHPHVHLMVYAEEGVKPYLSQKGVMNLRSAFAKDIFAQDLLCVYEKQTEHRDSLRLMMKDNPNIGKVWLCHDNDEGGEKAVRRISAALKEEHIEHARLTPVNKDWNEDLINLENLEETECESGMVMQ